MHEALLPKTHDLYRPRHSRHQRTALVAAGVFFLTPLLVWILGVRPEAFENRQLAEFPSLSEGWGFFTKISAWATDHMVLRREAVRAADGISRSIFGEPMPLDQGQLTGPLGGTPSSQTAQPPVAGADQLMVRPGFSKVIEGKDGWLFFGLDLQAKCVPDHSLDEVFGRLQKLRQAVQSSGRTFVLLVPPDKTTVETANLPDTYGGKECGIKVGQDFWHRMSTEPDAVDLRSVFNTVKQQTGRPMYHKLDTHWNDDGAVVAIRQLTERLQAGLTANWIIDFGETYSNNADLALMAGRKDTLSWVRYEVKPNGAENRVKKIDSDLTQPYRITTGQLPGTFGKPTLMLGDSFMRIASRYFPAAFTDLTLWHSAQISQDPAAVSRVAAAHDVVVFEAVERSLIGGTAHFLNPEFIDVLTKELASQPRR